MKIGLIQSRGIGDIIIALPIAKYFIDRGHKVVWPINEEFLPSFVSAAPYVEFLAIKRGVGPGGWYDIPLGYLRDRSCDQIIALYHYLARRPDVAKPELAATHKFDEYKYAVAGVPFREKWNLEILRDRDREERLFRDVVGDRGRDFVVAHLEGHNVRASIDLEKLAQGRTVIQITNRTDNVFDWLSIIERASLRIMIDSCYSNLIDQLKISGPKMIMCKRYLALEQTPILLGDWDFLPPPFVMEPHATVPEPAIEAKGGVPAAHEPATRTGRNEPCPCGSGKKYKQCHGSLV